jgi:transposase-like protein
MILPRIDGHIGLGKINEGRGPYMKWKSYDEEFKRDAVELLLRSGRPLKPLAKELGISDSSLRTWRDTYLSSTDELSE